MLSFPGHRRHSHDNDNNAGGAVDPESTESNQLIPARKRRHRVRVQGRLAVVRSVSAANLRPPALPSSLAPALPSPVPAAAVGGGTATPAPPKFESGVAGSAAAPTRGRGMTTRGRGRSVDDASSDAGEEQEQDDDDDARETAVRDRQFRGYGIGGAGNIRRPTEVYGATSKPGSLSSRFSIFNSSGSGSGSPPAETDRAQWSFREFFARTGERKGKGVA
ncbi:hypothetical protein CTA2_398 [Colletotrichum tanaceti]|uniref:Uncharacterized protein n=1 Tax=Colletotrichum tanaceti TaxID=1306861 RepID=A0A4U6X2M4_9PEZI|nr:hypothetical protein CTA2_398 [Colletotrichum tanaceti]TKW49153.1 hypothetical protein CTA1_12888 [Colletotrichum tanaceti]